MGSGLCWQVLLICFSTWNASSFGFVVSNPSSLMRICDHYDPTVLELHDATILRQRSSRTTLSAKQEKQQQQSTPISRALAADDDPKDHRDSATIMAPVTSPYVVSIAYCTGCRWGLRSFYMAQELLTTFQDNVALQAVVLLPSRGEPGGVFSVQCYNRSTATTTDRTSNNSDVMTLWDRVTNQGFPEIKTLKQLVRDQIDPDRYLGHSDRSDRQDAVTAEATPAAANVASTPSSRYDGTVTALTPLVGTKSPGVAISYCTGCRWLLRAAYLGQELLSTLDTELNSVALIPIRDKGGGQFTISIDGVVVWDRAERNGFPGVSELKQLVRDRLSPGKDLGHSDVSTEKAVVATDSCLDETDDEDARDARAFYGVL
jgi:selenoprotein W-related protein